MNRLTACFEKKKSSPYASDTKYEELFSIVRNAKLYSYKELEIATKNFNPKNKIGEGCFGSVYKGRVKDDTLAAIKVIKSQNEHEVHEILNKIETFSELEHENLVKMYGCCLEGHHRVFVRDYLENDSIAQTFLGGDSSKVQFSWKIRFQICIGVAQGLAFLHEEVESPIVHGEVKASNIFLDRDFTPKISDFGLAKLFPPRIGDCVSVHQRWAPEQVSVGTLTWKSDIYSFGVLILEIVRGRRSFDAELPHEERNLVIKDTKEWKIPEFKHLCINYHLYKGGDKSV